MIQVVMTRPALGPSRAASSLLAPLALLTSLACNRVPTDHEAGERPIPDREPPRTTAEIEPEPEPKAEAEPKVEAEPALADGHVVVASGSQFFASADAREPIATRTYLEDELPGHIEADHVGWVMARGETRDGRVELSLIPGDAPASSCGHGMEGLDAFALTWWVDEDALLEVSTAETKLRFADGSSLTLAPGVPLIPASADEPGHLDAWGLRVPIEGATVVGRGALPRGRTFIPAALPPFEGEPGEPGSRELRLAGEALDYMDLLLLPQAEREVEGQPRLVFRGPCVELEPVFGEGKLGGTLSPIGTLGTLGGGYSLDNYAFFAVPAGATVRWPDGSRAGTVRRDLRLYEPQAPRGPGFDGQCVYVSAGNRHRDVALCFAAADIDMLELGWIEASEVELSAKGEDLDSRIQWLSNRLREPCLSHAIEADPKLDLRVAVTARYGAKPRTPAEVTLSAKAGKLDGALRQCLSEAIGGWLDPRLRDHELKLELHMRARAPTDEPAK